MSTLLDCQLGDRVNVAGLGVCDLVGTHFYTNSLFPYLLGWRQGEPPCGDGMAELMSYWTRAIFVKAHEKLGPLHYLPNINEYETGRWSQGDKTCILLSRGVQSPTHVVGAPVNNHTCPTCKNDRVNRSEENCWLCGGKL
jgi:hypothetical protein